MRGHGAGLVDEGEGDIGRGSATEGRDVDSDIYLINWWCGYVGVWGMGGCEMVGNCISSIVVVYKLKLYPLLPRYGYICSTIRATNAQRHA